MRDAAGELADALEPLRLAELRLEALALGHVTAVQHDALDVRVVELPVGHGLDVDPGAVAVRIRHSTGLAGAWSRAIAAMKSIARGRSSRWIRSASGVPS